MPVLLDVFKGGEVAEGDVSAGVPWPVCFDCVREGFVCLKEDGELLAEVDVQECIEVMEEGDWATIS